MATDSKGTSLGIFVSDKTITLVQVRASRAHLEVVAHGVTETPPGTIEKGTILAPSRLATAIRAVMRENGISAKSVSVALFSAGYNMRVLQLPNIPAREQRVLVRGELEALTVLPPGGGSFDFIWSVPPSGSGNRQAEVYAYYTADATIEDVRESVRSAGLQLRGIEPASLAMIRAYLAAKSQRHPVAFLYASEQYSDLCLHDGERIQHIRRIPAGWGDFARETATNPLAESHLQEEAEANLTGAFAEARDDAPLAGNIEAEPAPPMPSRALDRLASTSFLAAEIMRTLAFYAREFPTAPRPDEMVVLGIDSIIPDFRLALAESLPLPLADLVTSVFGIALPWDDVSGSAGTFLASIGAAIGELEAVIPPLDISRQEIQAQARQRAPIQLLTGLSVGTIWAVASAVGAIALTVMQSADEQRIVQVKQELETIKQQRAPLLRGQQVVTAIQAARSRSEVPVAPILGRVAAATTAGVELTGLHISEDGKVTVDGRALNSAYIQRFATLLGLGRAIPAPSFEMLREDDKNELQFRIAGTYPKPTMPVSQPPAASTAGQ